MAPLPSLVALRALRTLINPSHHLEASTTHRILFPHKFQHRAFTTTSPTLSTLNQVRRSGRPPQKKRRAESPAMHDRPAAKGVCLKVGITKPKKPNSGQRKTAKIRLSNGRIISAYIPGEGHNVQQHSVVMVRGGRSQDCPGVRYHLVRGSMDLGGVPNRIRSRSKYGTKKPKSAV